MKQFETFKTRLELVEKRLGEIRKEYEGVFFPEFASEKSGPTTLHYWFHLGLESADLLKEKEALAHYIHEQECFEEMYGKGESDEQANEKTSTQEKPQE